ncbi:MAG: AHH domain-containing protein, partial [Bryobacteraceae bacterium]|nr:AHH domain-containing protein [Bryobacteraceae bacterium]
ARAGVYGAPGTAAHHIVSRYSKNKDNVASKKILAKHGISLDSAINGVYLPAKATGTKATGAIHSSLHTNDYYQHIRKQLEAADANGKSAVEETLKTIGRQLADGSITQHIKVKVKLE